MARSGKVRIDIQADASGVQRGTADAERSLEKLNRTGSRAFSGLGKAAAAASVAIGGLAVVGIVKATNAASDLDEQMNKSAAVFKSASDEVKAFSSTTATSLGISQRAALEATGTFGNMLVPMGIGRQKAADMSVQMVKLAADMASFNNATPEDTLEALRAGLAGESEPLRKFGVFLNDARLKQEALSMGLYNGKGALDANAKAQATYSLILKDSKDAQGDFARTSDGLANSQRIARAQLEDTAATLGTTFIPVAAKVLVVINDVVQAARRNWPRFKQVTLEAFEAARQVVARAMAYIDANVVPTIRSIVRNAQRFWNTFGGDITAVFQFVRRTVERSMQAVRAIITGVLAVLRGDWSTAWKSLRQVVTLAFAQVRDLLGTMPRVLGSIARKIGIAIVDGIVGGIRDAAGRIRSAIADAIPNDITPGFDVPGFAGGGLIPGRYRGRDDRLAMVASGEAILTPRQQAMVPGGRSTLMEIFARTGGRMGGDRFAVGGVAGGASRYTNPFPGGNWAGGPSAHGARALGNWQSDNAWDIMGKTGQAVYAVLPGTIGRVSASDSRPGFAGQGVYLDTADGQWWYKHIRASVSPGQKVNAGDVIGTLVSWTNGGPHLHLATPSGDPARARNGMAPGASNGSAGDGQGAEPSPPKPNGPTLAQRIAKLVGPTYAKSLGSGAPDLSDGSAPSFTSSQNRSVSSAGRNARAAARAAGMSPEAVANAGEEAERRAEVAVLNRQLSNAEKDMKSLRSRKADLLTAFQRLGRTKVGPKNRAAKRKAMAKMRADLRAYTEEMSEVREEIAEIKERLAEIGEQAAAEDYQEAYEDRVRAASTPTGPTPDQQAAIDQANTRADVATRSQGISDSFLRTLFGSGSIDPGMGSVNVNIQTLHPGDPALQGEIARWIVGALGGQGSVPASTFRV